MAFHSNTPLVVWFKKSRRMTRPIDGSFYHLVFAVTRTSGLGDYTVGNATAKRLKKSLKAGNYSVPTGAADRVGLPIVVRPSGSPALFRGTMTRPSYNEKRTHMTLHTSRHLITIVATLSAICGSVKT